MAKVWKKLQRADSDFTGNVTGTFGSKSLSAFYRTDNKPTKSDVGLGNIDNSKFDSSGKFKGELIKTDGTSVFNPSTGDFTGKIDGTDASTVKSKADAAKNAIDGNASITMVGGSLSIGTQSGGVYPFSVDSLGNLKIQNDEFQALANGTVNCKGNFTINQDPSGDSKILLKGDNTGQAEVEVQGANPTFDLGGTNPLGTSTLFIRRGGTGNQARILFQTATTNKFGIGVSHTVDNDQFWIHNGNGYSGSSPHPERVLSFDPDGKTGFFSNSKTVNGFTFGSDGTNKHVYIKDGSLGINTAPSDTWKLDIAGAMQSVVDSSGGVAGNIKNSNANGYGLKIQATNAGTKYITTFNDKDDNVKAQVKGNGQFTCHSIETTDDVFVGDAFTVDGGDADFMNNVTFHGNTSGLNYNDLANKPTIPAANTLSYSTSTIDGNGYLWIMPTQFMPNDDNSYFNAAIVDNGAQARVMSSSLELYANVPIPTGYKVTHACINGTASVQIGIYYSDVTTATATSAQVTTLYTNSDNAVNPSSGIAASTSGRYMILRWQPTSTSHRLYGARLRITKI